MLNKIGTCTIALLLLFSAGCGPAAPNLPPPVPVTGKILLDKEPLGDAMVFFVPMGENMGNGSAGVTKADGTYELSTNIGTESKKGAVPGEYKVWVSRLVTPDGKPIVLKPDEPPANHAAMESLPSRFSNASETEFKATVGATGGNFDFTVSLR